MQWQINIYIKRIRRYQRGIHKSLIEKQTSTGDLEGLATPTRLVATVVFIKQSRCMVTIDVSHNREVGRCLLSFKKYNVDIS